MDVLEFIRELRLQVNNVTWVSGKSRAVRGGCIIMSCPGFSVGWGEGAQSGTPGASGAWVVPGLFVLSHEALGGAREKG